MGQPSVPKFLVEGPASACVIDAQQLGWKNCTCLSFAMGIDKSTLGRVHLSGCQVRKMTGDTDGGTTIEQNAKVAEKYGVHVEIHTGPGVTTPYYAAVQLQKGRGISLAGNTLATGRGNVNHNIWVNHVKGGSIGHPAFAMVDDPWSSGPAWWTWAKVMAFAAALRPWGEHDPRTLGSNRFHCAIFPDTEPHVHLRYGGARTSPFPDHVVIHSPVAGRRVNVRSGPSKAHPVVRTLASGTAWIAFQVALGQTLEGSASWRGNHDGNEWVHSSGTDNEGGAS